MPSPKSKFTVSIVTRTKNRPRLLRRAIQSVLDQSHTNWTHIIVNDGGNKKDVESITNEFKRKYAGRLIKLHHSTSLGREAASNAGLGKCNSQYIVFLDDDDTWHPDFLKRCLAALKSSPLPNVSGVMCHSVRVEEFIEEDGQIVEVNRRPFNSQLQAVEIPRMCTNNVIPNMSFLFKKSLINEIGGFDENLEVLGDWDFNIRAALAGEILVVPESLAFFHQRPHARTSYGNSYYVHKEDLFKTCRAQVINKWVRAEYARGNYSIAQAMTFASLNQEGYKFSLRANKILAAFAEWAEKE